MKPPTWFLQELGILNTSLKSKVRINSVIQEPESYFRYLYTTIMGLAYTALIGVILVYIFYKWRFRYWDKRNVRVTSPRFPFGDIYQAAFYKNVGDVLKEIYQQFEGERYNGMWCFYRPYLMIRDPDLIKTLLIKDFGYFRDRGLYSNEKVDPLSANLFFINGLKWRILRTKLSSNFSSGKMKKIFDIMAEKSKKLQEILENPANKREVILPKEFTILYTHDVAASSLLGLPENCLQNHRSPLPMLGKKLFEPTWPNIIRFALSFFLPDLAVLLRVALTPDVITNFFLDSVKNAIVKTEQNIEKSEGFNDFINLLVKLKNEKSLKYVNIKDINNNHSDFKEIEDCRFSCDNAVAQAFIFWMGAFESSASTMQLALFEMSLNTSIQEKAREEVKRVLAKFDGQFTYESLSELEYLGRVVSETLRKYPPVPVITRLCLKSYKIPDSEVVIEKGVPIIISVAGLHMDPTFYPDPEKFDPDRFTEEEKRKRHRYSYLPFGEGLHQCIGQRYALMQIKLGLANLLAHYKFEIVSSTKLKAKICRKVVFYTVKNGIPLKISKLQE